MNMQTLHPLTFPLSGTSLIEASAGTGKTYTIVNLYLRLLLGHGCAPLSVEQILVVTFTKAATAELKSRIRDKLSQAYFDFYLGSSEDDNIKALIDDCDDVELARDRLALAIRQMDEASVYTIHSFCQRMLTQHAFESGAIYEQQVVLDESEWQHLAVCDFWRRHIVPLPYAVNKLVLAQFKSPDALLTTLRPLLNRQVTIDDAPDFSQCVSLCNLYAEAVGAFKQWWQNNGVAAQMQQAGFKGNMSLGKADTYLKIERFCASDELLPEFNEKQGWLLFSQENISKSLSAKGQGIGDMDFSRCERLAKLLQDCQLALKPSLCQFGLHEVRALLADIKQRMGLLSPDDLMRHLQSALNRSTEGTEQMQSNSLRDAIVAQYPAAMIDEFQDTDEVQFAIFSALYMDTEKTVTEANTSTQPETCFIMIGDPKQAIYAFRGADIYTYLKAKRGLPDSRLFTLATNYRSDPRLINSINGVFEHSDCAFLFDDIPFQRVGAGKSPAPLSVDGESVTPLNLHHLVNDGEPLSWNAAGAMMAQHTACEIGRFLQQGAEVDGQPVKAGDCCVLVRDRHEAHIVRRALKLRGIDSVFQVKTSVFKSTTARDLCLLLRALANPGNERIVRAAMCTELFGYTANELDKLFTDELAWQSVIDKCIGWQYSWQRFGVMMAVVQVSEYFGLYSRLTALYDDGIRRLTDLRHLTELLQEQSLQTPSMSQLLHWFEQHLLDPDDMHESQQIRLETDENLVQIITMHASKGLEYPLVFIPFAARAREAKDIVYHDQHQQLRADFNRREGRQELVAHEQLAEDIRLFYVAVTRAVHYCMIGVWNSTTNPRKKESHFCLSAIGRLLIKQEDHAAASSGSADQLIAQAMAVLQQSVDVEYRALLESDINATLQLPSQAHDSETDATNAKPDDLDGLRVSTLSRPVPDDWQLTSYSSISRQQSQLEHALPGRDEGSRATELSAPEPAADETLSRFTFTRGAQAGSFLHAVLENIDFTRPDNLHEVIEQQGQWYGIESQWYEMVACWIEDVLGAGFSDDASTSGMADVCLGALPAHQVLVEMEFHLPLRQVKEVAFNRIVQAYTPDHQRFYRFEEINGMLKGFIDLIFTHDGKYYVADYKSNHVGDTPEHYQRASLLEVMNEHDYHLQALLYVLALHRWLKSRLVDYEYEQHVGGAYYFFLRGMTADRPGNGVYFSLPDSLLIKTLDALFDGTESPGQIDTSASDKPDESAAHNGQMSLW